MISTEFSAAGIHAVRALDAVQQLVENVSTDAMAHSLAMDAGTALTQLIEHLEQLKQEEN